MRRNWNGATLAMWHGQTCQSFAPKKDNQWQRTEQNKDYKPRVQSAPGGPSQATGGPSTSYPGRVPAQRPKDGPSKIPVPVSCGPGPERQNPDYQSSGQPAPGGSSQAGGAAPSTNTPGKGPSQRPQNGPSKIPAPVTGWTSRSPIPDQTGAQQPAQLISRQRPSRIPTLGGKAKGRRR
ncbi:hypothetical protein C1H76_7581 [Elsinoe australis]|uniref:Uncharacterized protein n=1 Tax=Elsinoe australis TaxID=40998 RepID=A0A4U7AUW6_9PEZI|nr:hypothetical protein C1H76_7581 [Elsinoe australis]